MAAGPADLSSRTLGQTPTWAVALVVAVIILISLLLEKGLHHLGEWFTEHRLGALYEALEKVKAELMILGFISLLLTFSQNYIVQICIPESIANTMLPCRLELKESKNDVPKDVPKEDIHHRRLLWDSYYPGWPPNHRMLAAEGDPVSCKEGSVPLFTTNALHQLHIFIFFLAVFHVVYSASTMALGRLKIRSWRAWEDETLSSDYEFSNDPSRFRLSNDVTFVKQHNNFWNKVPVLFYAACFFRQFYRSVRKADYMTLRHGFINAHLAPGNKFDFQRYIKRSLDDDFKVVVGISPVLWASAVVVLLMNVAGFFALFWISLIPLVILLAVGTHLQAIIAKMALDIHERNAVIIGIPLVQLTDKYFWFNRPHLILSLIHFTLFQNAFQITYFVWITFEFGVKSCFHDKLELIIIRVAIGFIVQFLCSYITLPLYALVTQMGSHMKKTIFDEHTAKALKKWHQAVKKKHGHTPRHLDHNGASPSASPAHSMQRAMSSIHKPRSTYDRNQHFETEMSDMEGDTSPMHEEAVLFPRSKQQDSTEARNHPVRPVKEPNIDDFSFAKVNKSSVD